MLRSPTIKTAYETSDLKAKLARWHKDVDNAFYGWNGAWLDPAFRNWDISEYLAYIRVPVAILQGRDDEYGTMRQIEIAQEECYCPVDVTVIPGAGHQPHREAPGATLDAVQEFANAVLRVRRLAGTGRVSYFSVHCLGLSVVGSCPDDHAASGRRQPSAAAMGLCAGRSC